MRVSVRFGLFRLLLLGLCMLVGVREAQAQISEKRLQELKAKYDWGSIYLSYGVIPDVIQVLENAVRLEKIKVAYNCSPPKSMVAFLSRYRTVSSRRSIALFQINFSGSTPAAGFLIATDLNGTINRVPMTGPEVLMAADWIDLYLTHASEFAKTFSDLESSKSTLLEAWARIGKLNADPFVSEGYISSLLVVFRRMQTSKAAEFESLSQTNSKMYKTLKLFSTQFDQATSGFWDEFAQKRAILRGLNEEMALQQRDLQSQLMLEKSRGWSPAMKGYIRDLWVGDDFEVYQDNLRLKIYQSYQQILDQSNEPIRPGSRP